MFFYMLCFIFSCFSFVMVGFYLWFWCFSCVCYVAVIVVLHFKPSNQEIIINVWFTLHWYHLYGLSKQCTETFIQFLENYSLDSILFYEIEFRKLMFIVTLWIFILEVSQFDAIQFDLMENLGSMLWKTSVDVILFDSLDKAYLSILGAY